MLDLSDSHHPLNQARLGEGQASLLVQAIWSPVGDQPDVLQRMVSWRPISEMGGVFTLLIFRDLEPLEKSLHQQRAFINTLAHELRTPLAILTGSLRRLDRKSQLAAPLDRVLDDAIGETKRMAALVDKLLLLSELDTDHFHWNLKRAPLQQFLDQWLRNLEPNRRSNVSLQVDESLSSCWIDLDEIAVFRILDTLLENSLLFGSEGMILHISESVSPQSVDLVVFLNGAGSSDKQDCNEVMDQSEPREFKFVVGDGDEHNLGMSVVKNLVEGMGGLMLWNNIRKQATATGPAKMTLRFPLVNPDGEGSAVSEDVDPEAQEDAQINQA
nr:HAMP domain-containing sensor histidine kinase [Synechococcus sp. PROS-7-1]